MQAFINSFFLVFAGEMGDKTQLLALVLAARYRKPWLILGGVCVATLINHAMAAYAGAWFAEFFTEKTLLWILAITFLIFAVWILIPDKEEELNSAGHMGVFMTTVIAFFIAEMGDKTQFVTIALGARYANTMMVIVGTTVGMMGSNALAIFFGHKFLSRIPMKWVRLFTSLLFILFSVASVVRILMY